MTAFAGKRILLIAETNPCLQDARGYRQWLALLDQGYQVTIICQRPGGQRWREDHRGMQIYSFPAPPTGQTAPFKLLRHAYPPLAVLLLSLFAGLSEGFDVVYLHTPSRPFGVLTLIYQRLGKPVLATLQQPMPPYAPGSAGSRTSVAYARWPSLRWFLLASFSVIMGLSQQAPFLR
jgi:Glycosyl transferase 4-like domain